MLVEVILVQELITNKQLSEKAVVVIDTLRATSTMVTALAHGAKEIIPFADLDQLAGLKNSFQNCLFTGERDGEKIPGFDLGNSPLEFTVNRVSGKSVLMNTTNGTRALLGAAGAEKVIVASFLNSRAVAQTLVFSGLDILVVCSGTKGNFSLEDFAAAGMLMKWLWELESQLMVDDAAWAATALYEKYSGDLQGLLCITEHGRKLAQNGYSKDLRFCAQKDIFQIVPRFDCQKLS